MKATKKQLYKHVNFIKKRLVHPEGSKYLCDCLIKNYRNWLGLKLNGKKDEVYD